MKLTSSNLDLNDLSDIKQVAEPQEEEVLLKRSRQKSEESAPGRSSAASLSSETSGGYSSLGDDEIPGDKTALLRRYIALSLVKQLCLWFVFFYLQHLGACLLILGVQIYFYKELTTHGVREDKEAQLGWVLKGGFRLIYWYWFILASLLLHWAVIDPQLTDGFRSTWHLPLGRKQKADYEFSIFFAYVLGLVGFVLMLRKRHYKYQFERFAYCHVLLFFFSLSCLLMRNVFTGLIYFVLPLQLVAVNSLVLKFTYVLATGRDDTFHYKHSSFAFRLDSLPNLSFFIAWMATIAAGFLISRLLISHDLFTCRKTDVLPEYWPTCETQPEFVLQPLKEVIGANHARRFPSWVANFEVCQFDEHVFWFAQFASFVAPFGGFFTAAFKRALRLRTDFGQGPFADRLDCLLLTGVFVFTYISARVENTNDSAADTVLDLMESLEPSKRLQIFKNLGKNLALQGILE